MPHRMPWLPLLLELVCLRQLTTPSSAQAYNHTEVNSFCLTPEQGRVLSNKSLQLYNQTIHVGYTTQAVYIGVWQYAMQLIVSEIYGYPTNIVSSPSSMIDQNVYQLMANASVDVDFFHLEKAAIGEAGWYSQYVTTERVVSDMGLHYATMQGGLYFPTELKYQYPELSLDWWRQYLTSQGPDARAAINIFRRSSWQLLNATKQYLRDLADPTSFVCKSDSEYIAMGFPPQGCGTVAGYEGMFVPKQCQADPENDCLVAFVPSPVVNNLGQLQSAIHTLGLNFTLAFVNYLGLDPINLQSALPALSYSLNVYPAPSNLNYNTSVGTVEKLFTRLQLPTFDQSCLTGYSGSAYQPYTCDYPVTQLGKFARTALAAEAPRVFALAGNMQVTQADTSYMAEQMLLTKATTDNDLYSVACGWLRNNVELWTSWTSPAADCSAVDYSYSVSDCSSSGERTLTYYWLQPKACQYGVDLPSPQTISCAYVAVGSSESVMWITLYAVLSAATVALMAYSLWQCFAGTSYVRGAASKIQQLLVNQLSGVSCLLLLGVLMVNVGALTVNQCWLKHALFWCGISICQIPYLLRVAELCKRIQRQLSNSMAKSLIVLCVLPILWSTIIFTASATGNDSTTFNILQTKSVTVFGGAIVHQPYCDVMRASYIVYELLTVIGLLALRSWAYIVQSAVRLSVEIHTFQEAAKHPKRAKSALQQLEKTYKHRTALTELVVAFVAVHFLLVTYLIGTTTDASNNIRWTNALNITIVITMVVAMPLQHLKLEALYTVIGRWLHTGSKRSAKQVAAVTTSDSHTIAIDDIAKRKSLQPSGLSECFGTQAVMDGEFESLAGTLGDPVAHHFYKQFVTAAADSESLLFVEDVWRLISRCETVLELSISAIDNASAVEALMNSAEQIVQEYIVAGSNHQVNLAASLVQRVRSELNEIAAIFRTSIATAELTQSAQTTPPSIVNRLVSLFTASVKEVCNLMATNSWPRFLRSKAAAEADEIIQWSMTFDVLTSEQQTAALKRLHKHHRHQQKEQTTSYEGASHSIPSMLHATTQHLVPVPVRSSTPLAGGHSRQRSEPPRLRANASRGWVSSYTPSDLTYFIVPE